MQGNYGSESGLPLNELLTVVMVTHNRPAFARRAIKFYSTLPCRILLLDSSTQVTDGIDGVYPSVDYRHVPQFGYQGLRAKLDYGVKEVTTPYMVFAADDDFILHDGIKSAVSFLEDNADYGMCHGYCLMYLTLASSVSYYRRDKKVCEDYSSERAQDRVIDFMQQYIPPFYAVHRVELLRDWYATMPENISFEWQEIGHAYYMLARSKARMLPIPYVVREVNYMVSEHKTEVYTTLAANDAKSVAEREAFAELLSTLPREHTGLDPAQGKQLALESFDAMADCLRTGRSLTSEPIIESRWTNVQKGPERRFGLFQYVELPYYNQPFFDLLSEIEFLLHAMPAGRVQLQGLEGIWADQENMMRPRNNDTAESVVDRLWHAYDAGPFNRQVVKRLVQQLELLGEEEPARDMRAWSERLNAVSTQGNEEAFGAMRSGRLLNWLAARAPDADEVAATSRYLAEHRGGPQFGILVLDLDNDAAKLQITLDSLLEGRNHAFKIVVFTTGEPLAATTEHNTLHFVRVTLANHVDKLNQVVRQSACDWMILTEAGDEFTAGGLLRAGLELLAAPECRAVASDEIHRDAHGALVDVFRPGFNLDLLQSLPALMARHWLIRKDVLLAAGGYQADFSKALEFDVLLRIIEEGGLAWLAHLDEPLMIARTPVLEDNAHERQALVRHLATRGYKAQVSSEEPGTYRIDYRHAERPLVSIIVPSQDNLESLQRCLTGILQRTRYTRYEIVIADNASQSPELLQWLDGLGQPGDRVRVLRSHERLSESALFNEASRQAEGEYLVLLAADGEVVNPNWLESLLNQAQRPEVGVVGTKLQDHDGNVTQAGLILGMNDGVGSAFVGEKKDAKGYLNRLVLEQNYSAVSAVCLMIRKALFDEVGGLDEAAFAEAFADVDLCLKAGQAGYLVVWTPQVQVIHPGTLPDAPQALQALREKWADAFQHDLAYNKNLALTGKGFTLGNNSSVNWARLLA
ncbi:TIGR00180 family glycosyltransferase [Pseudomonas sp. PB120]|uniref:TIGR00180 family glycosyltransferase n=1 Tax=Pseudomonas sp. PB120 TaxID=2494700 RepID=UPI0012FE2D6B|nr:TIGR00180 family glycosyltransferase [Pseudomonas sp. PB120]MVV51320.1 TIGR00180 family glycosyltransferase [Pseudomonas sp. PB120]